MLEAMERLEDGENEVEEGEDQCAFLITTEQCSRVLNERFKLEQFHIIPLSFPRGSSWYEEVVTVNMKWSNTLEMCRLNGTRMQGKVKMAHFPRRIIDMD